MSDPNVTLTGEKVILRPFATGDVGDAYLGWMNDRAANPYLLGARTPVARDDLVRYVEASAADERSFLFAVCDRESGVHIGNARLYDVSVADRHGIYGWLIGDVAFRGRGAGADALVQLLRFGFHHLDLHRIWGMVAVANAGATRCSEKAGMVREGILREVIRRGDGFLDASLFAMLRPEFDRRHGGPDQW